MDGCMLPLWWLTELEDTSLPELSPLLRLQGVPVKLQSFSPTDALLLRIVLCTSLMHCSLSPSSKAASSILRSHALGGQLSAGIGSASHRLSVIPMAWQL